MKDTCGRCGRNYDPRFFCGRARDYDDLVCWDCWQQLDKCIKCSDVVEHDKMYVHRNPLGGEIEVCDRCIATLTRP